ncbi:MAG: hypothetical protein JWO33_811 [Caulobacteraceae bacterium]|nr:hypothetical protein [Caulobacteraceae bacterium]
MSVALILSSQPIDAASVEKAVGLTGANVAVLPVTDVEFDEQDSAGVAELMAYVRAEHALCLRDKGVELYASSIFDALFDRNVSTVRAELVVAAVEASITEGSYTCIALLDEWDGLASTRLLRGNIEHLRRFLEVDGGWPALRFIDARSRRAGELQTDYGTVVFQVER